MLYDVGVVPFLILVREKHSEEYCAMYDICGERVDGKVLNCPYGSSSVKVCSFWLFTMKLKRIVSLFLCFIFTIFILRDAIAHYL